MWLTFAASFGFTRPVSSIYDVIRRFSQCRTFETNKDIYYNKYCLKNNIVRPVSLALFQKV